MSTFQLCSKCEEVSKFTCKNPYIYDIDFELGTYTSYVKRYLLTKVFYCDNVIKRFLARHSGYNFDIHGKNRFHDKGLSFLFQNIETELKNIV